MMNFLNQYPLVKLILIGFGILYALDKYFGFNPLDKLLDKLTNKFRRYKFKKYSHLNDIQLKQIIEDFNQKKINIVESTLKKMNSSYRSFAFKSLAQYGIIEATDEWIQNDNTNIIPKIIKGHQLIEKAWEIRGSGTIDTVSKSNLISFKACLKEAEELFLVVNEESSEFQSNIISSLLTISKAIDVNREKMHALFYNAQKTNLNDAELNLNYYSFISEKWGGTEKEINEYKDDNGIIKNFISRFKNEKIDDNELYRYELYLLLYWISNNLGLTDFENHFKQKVEPYWED